MKTILSLIVLLSISTASFSQIAFNRSAEPTTEYSKTLISEKEKSQLAAQQTQVLANHLSSYITNQLGYSKLMEENSIEGILLLKVTFSRTGKIVASEIIESPHFMLSAKVMTAMEMVTVDGLKNTPYYGPEEMIIPITFSMR